MIDVLRTRRTRRIAAATIALAGVLDLVSALTPPIRDRLHLLLEVVPLAVPQTAASLVALIGVALLVLARGVRTGQQRAWRCSLALLVGSAVLHLVKGADLEETLVALALAAWLVRVRGAFTHAEVRGVADRVVLVGVFATSAVAVVATQLLPFGGDHPPWRTSLWTSPPGSWASTPACCPTGWTTSSRPSSPSPASRSSSSAGSCCSCPAGPARSTDATRARSIVERFGGDTLAYFALRDDKQQFFWRRHARRLRRAHTACASCRPIRSARSTSGPRRGGPSARFADDHGWTVAVLGRPPRLAADLRAPAG